MNYVSNTHLFETRSPSLSACWEVYSPKTYGTACFTARSGKANWGKYKYCSRLFSAAIAAVWDYLEIVDGVKLWFAVGFNQQLSPEFPYKTQWKTAWTGKRSGDFEGIVEEVSFW